MGLARNPKQLVPIVPFAYLVLQLASILLRRAAAVGTQLLDVKTETIAEQSHRRRNRAALYLTGPLVSSDPEGLRKTL